MIDNGSNKFIKLNWKKGDTMDLSFRTEENKKVDKMRVAMFCERYASMFVRASPEEIIMKWLDYQFARYQINELDDGFYINDYEEKKLVAFISKDDPRAFVHAFELCEGLNNPPEPFSLSIDGREMVVAEPNPLVSLKDNEIVDFLINNIKKNKK